MVNNVSIGRFMRELREDKNLTHLQVAEQLDVSEKDVVLWEQGEKTPAVSVLQSLADLYDVSVRELLNGSRRTFEDPEPSERDVTAAILEYGQTSVQQQSRESRKQWFILISVLMLVIIAAVMLIEWLTTSRFSWSLIVMISIILAWGTIVPVFLPIKKPMLMSLITFTILTIPFLYAFDLILTLDGLMLRLSIPIAIIVFVYCWGLYFAYKRLNLNRLQFAAAALLGATAVMILINIIISVVLGDPFFTILNIMTILILGGLGGAAIYFDRQKNQPPQ